MMGGTLQLHSEVGVGTTVVVDFSVPLLEKLVPDHEESQIDIDVDPSRILRILIVDDYEPNRALLQQQLTMLGHVVTAAEDGEQGWEYWQKGDFALVITDCRMPMMNGYELTRRIRAAEHGSQMTDPEQVKCVIYGYTANAQIEEIARCRQAGMDDCLFKPVSMNTLRKHLSSMTAIEHAEPHAFLLPKLANNNQESDIFDIALLDAYTDGDPVFTKIMLQKMIVAYQKDADQLNAALQQRQWQIVGEIAHRLKGGAGVANATSLINVY